MKIEPLHSLINTSFIDAQGTGKNTRACPGIPAVDMDTTPFRIYCMGFSLTPLVHTEAWKNCMTPLIADGETPVAVDALVILRRHE